MSLFKRLFGKKEKQFENSSSRSERNLEELEKSAMENLSSLSQKDQDLFLKMMGKMSNSAEISTNTPALFRTELYDTLSRYYSSPELRADLDLKDEKGNLLEEHEAFDVTFNQWRQVRSVWDKRTILFEHWDESEFKKLQKWQIIERFVKDRYALKAVDFQKSNITLDDFQDIRLIVALSKLYRVLDSIPQALHYAKGAYELREDLDIVKTEYANVLHLSGSQEEKDLAHNLIGQVIKNKISNESTGQEIPLLNYFTFSVGYIDSSIFAGNFLKVGNCDEATWEKVAEEYYWCPVFRFEHSVFLSQKGESLKALAKLDSLANEFPWYKNGVLANINAINQLRKQNNDNSFMTEEMTMMEKYKSTWKS